MAKDDLNESFGLEKARKHESGLYISKSLAIIFIIFFAVIILTVGLLVGLLARRTSIDRITYLSGEVTEILVSSTINTNTTTRDPFGDGPWQNIRLPSEIEPINYVLDFHDLDYDQGTYKGKTILEFKLKEALKHILFHIKYLTIESVELRHEANGPSEIAKHFEYVKNQYYVLESNSEFEAGNYELIVLFDGSTKIGNVGMYQSAYTEDDIEKEVIATKFEPTDARKAFPCFDEPALKATYEISIEHPLGTYALSNFPVDTSATFGNKIVTKFEKTFKMSTYLAAWAVVPDDFGYEERFSEKDNKPIRVYGRKFAKQGGYLKFAVDIAKKSLDYFENEYFQISDAVPIKIDLIAIPDYPSEAMENWGLVGFRESSLLFLNDTNDPESREYVASVIAHEISHFWFGNLVTCAWWNDLWLNEAMAAFLELKAVGYIYPDLKTDELALTIDTVPVMYDDAYQNSHPIEVDVTTPDQINNVFDSITYSKGAAVLRMLESVVGEIGFRDGLRDYLKNNKFSSGLANEFYNSLTLPPDMADKTTPEKFMASWLLQMNYPVIDVLLTRNADSSTTFKFAQDRFLLTKYDLDQNPTYVSPFGYVWEIYLRCQAGGTYDQNGGANQHFVGSIEEFTLFLNTKEAERKFDGRQFTWIKCNPDFKSYYLIAYENHVFNALSEALKLNPSAFSVGDRTYLLHISFQLAYEGTRSYAIPASVSSYLELNEKDYVPWRVFIYHMNQIARLLEHRGAFKPFSSYGISLVKSIAQELNIYEEEAAPLSHSKYLLKSNILNFLCRLQDKECLMYMSSLFNKIPNDYFINPDDNFDKNPLPTSIRASVYKYHLQNTNKYSQWFNVFQLFELTGDPQERYAAQLGLSYSRSTWILNLYLDELLSPDSKIRTYEFFEILNEISRNPAGRDLVWYFYRIHWDEIVSKFGLSSRTFGRSIKAITDSFGNEFLLQQMLDFFSMHPNAGAGTEPRKQALEIVKTNILWIDDREPDLEENLKFP